MELNKKNMIKIGGLIAFAILFYLLMSKLGIVWDFVKGIFEIFFPIILGACIAFVINIPMRAYERQFRKIKKTTGVAGFFRRNCRSFSLILAFISIIAVLTLVLCIIIPQIGITFKGLPDTFKMFWDKIVTWANETAWVKEYILPYLDISKIDWEQLFASVKSYIFSGAETVLVLSFNLASSFFSAIVDTVLAFFFAVYILLEKDKLIVQSKKVMYAFCKRQWVNEFTTLMKMASDTFSNFFTVQCVEALILGMLFFIVMTILQFPYALAISVLIAVTALIPVCGAFIGCVIGAFLIVMVNPIQAVWFVIVFLVLQQIENNLIYPRVVGNSVGLPAIWVLAAITVGGSMLGVAGMLIFVPLFSVFHAVLRSTVAKRLKMRHIYVNENGTVCLSSPREAIRKAAEAQTDNENEGTKVSEAEAVIKAENVQSDNTKKPSKNKKAQKAKKAGK